MSNQVAGDGGRRRVGRRDLLRIGAGLAAGGLLPADAAAQSRPAGTRPAGSARSPIDDPLVGYCGYNCRDCAGRSVNKELRLRMIAGWNRIFGHDYTPDKVPGSEPCCTCKGGGKVADEICKVRPCIREKGLRSCAECAAFPCEKVRPLIVDRNQALLTFCRRGAVTREDYELCVRQFESLPNLIAALVEKGKLPAWVEDYYSRD